jgi:CDP-diacylglycerol--serine O-phosphatidyltransferase
MLAAAGDFIVPKEIVVAISVVMATMLISPVRMFALKFKGFGWKGNELRYSFIVVSAVLIAAFTKYAAAGIILLYIVISTVRHIVNSAKK